MSRRSVAPSEPAVEAEAEKLPVASFSLRMFIRRGRGFAKAGKPSTTALHLEIPAPPKLGNKALAPVVQGVDSVVIPDSEEPEWEHEMTWTLPETDEMEIVHVMETWLASPFLLAVTDGAPVKGKKPTVAPWRATIELLQILREAEHLTESELRWHGWLPAAAQPASGKKPGGEGEEEEEATPELDVIIDFSDTLGIVCGSNVIQLSAESLAPVPPMWAGAPKGAGLAYSVEAKVESEKIALLIESTSVAPAEDDLPERVVFGTSNPVFLLPRQVLALQRMTGSADHQRGPGGDPVPPSDAAMAVEFHRNVTQGKGADSQAAKFEAVGSMTLDAFATPGQAAFGVDVEVISEPIAPEPVEKKPVTAKGKKRGAKAPPPEDQTPPPPAEPLHSIISGLSLHFLVGALIPRPKTPRVMLSVGDVVQRGRPPMTRYFDLAASDEEFRREVVQAAQSIAREFSKLLETDETGRNTAALRDLLFYNLNISGQYRRMSDRLRSSIMAVMRDLFQKQKGNDLLFGASFGTGKGGHDTEAVQRFLTLLHVELTEQVRIALSAEYDKAIRGGQVAARAFEEARDQNPIDRSAEGVFLAEVEAAEATRTREGFQAAARLLETGVSDEPDNVTKWVEYALHFIRKQRAGFADDVEMADECFRQALSLSHEPRTAADVRACAIYGLFLWERGTMDKAESLLFAVSEHDSDWGTCAKACLVGLYRTQGFRQEGLELSKRFNASSQTAWRTLANVALRCNFEFVALWALVECQDFPRTDVAYVLPEWLLAEAEVTRASVPKPDAEGTEPTATNSSDASTELQTALVLTAVTFRRDIGDDDRERFTERAKNILNDIANRTMRLLEALGEGSDDADNISELNDVRSAALSALAQMAAATGDWAEARTRLSSCPDEALSAKSGQSPGELAIRLTHVLLEVGDPLEAKETALAACRSRLSGEMKQPCAELWKLAAKAAIDLGQTEDAMDALAEANFENALDPDVWGWVAVAALKADSDERLSDAATAVSEAKRLGMENAALWSAIAAGAEERDIPALLEEAEIALGRTKDAVPDVEETVESSEKAEKNIATVRGYIERFDKSLEDVQIDQVNQYIDEHFAEDCELPTGTGADGLGEWKNLAADLLEKSGRSSDFEVIKSSENSVEYTYTVTLDGGVTEHPHNEVTFNDEGKISKLAEVASGADDVVGADSGSD